MKLPRWDCRNNPLLRRRLEEWTLDQLDKLDDEAVTQRDIEIMLRMNTDEFHEWWAAEPFRQQLRARVVKAAKAKDTRSLLRLTANNPELHQFAIRALTFKRGEGRPKGSRKTDIAGEKRALLEYAAIDVVRIGDIWQDNIWEDKLRHRNRTQSPTAVEIAARRWDVDVDELTKFRKNFSGKNFSVLTR
jgi:hypothetical protein